MNKQMEHDRKLIDVEWNRRVKAEKRLYESMQKSHKELNKNLNSVPADSKAFWKRTQNEMSKTLRDMSKTIAKEMSEVSKNLDKQMDKMISLSMQRQKKADEALRAAVKQGDQISIRKAAYNSRNESSRLEHAMRYKRTTLEISEAARQKSAYEARMSRGDTMSVEEYRAYEKVTDDIRDLENEMRKLELVNKHLADGITDLDQAIRAANLDIEYAEKHGKTFNEIISKAKVDMQEYAQNTFTFANAARHAGEAVKYMYKDYAMFTEQLYKMNGQVKLSDMSFVQMAKNTASLQVSSVKLRVFAASAGVTTEQFDQLNEKLFATYGMMDQFGKLDTTKYEKMSKEMLSYSRLTGASLDETIGLHIKLRRQFGMTDGSATRTMHNIMAAQKEVRGATSRSFSDFATFNDDFQKSIQSIVDGYEGFALDVTGVTALFKEQVKVAEKLGQSYEQAFGTAKKLTGFLTKKSTTVMAYHTGQTIMQQAGALFGGEGGLKKLNEMGSAEQSKYIDQVLGTQAGKASGFTKSQIHDIALATGTMSYSAAPVQVAAMMEGSNAMISAKLAQYKNMHDRGLNDTYIQKYMGFEGSADGMREFDMLKRTVADNQGKSLAEMAADLNKSGEKEAPGAKDNSYMDPANMAKHVWDALNNSALGSAIKALGIAGFAMGAHATAMGIHSMALLKDAGGKAAGLLGSLLGKFPGLKNLVGKGGATAAEGVLPSIVPGGVKQGGRLAGLLKNFGTPGKILAGTLLGAGSLYGAYKLFGGGSSTSSELASAQAAKAVAETADASGEQVDQQKETNKQLEKIHGALTGKTGPGSTSGSSLGSLLSDHPIATGAVGAAGAGGAYFALKKLLSSGGAAGTEKLAAEAIPAGASSGLLKGALAGTVGKVIGGVVGPAISFAVTDGPTGRKVAAAAGTALGTFAGGALGSFLGPVGTFVGGALGSAVGDWAGTALYDTFTGFDPNNPSAPATAAAHEALADQWQKNQETLPSSDAMMSKFMADSVAMGFTPSADGKYTPMAVGDPSKVYQSVNSLGIPTTNGQAGSGSGTFVNVDKNGSATLQATINIGNFTPSLNTAMRDSYNLQNPNSGLSRRGLGIVGGL
jgi:hypothetical protein